MLRGSLTGAIVAGAFVISNLAGPRKIAASRRASTRKVAPALAHASTSIAQAVLAADKRLLMATPAMLSSCIRLQGAAGVAGRSGRGPRRSSGTGVAISRDVGSAQWVDGFLPGHRRTTAASTSTSDCARSSSVKRRGCRCLPFSLDGSARAELRRAHRRALPTGASFEVVAADRAASLLSTLASISDDWLEREATAEKRFSLGSFSERCVGHFPIALVRCEGLSVAFANLWTTPSREELSVDLMRFDHGAPKGAMDFLFVELMLWAKARGYGWFNLGMAPLSGLGAHRLAPL